MKLLLKKEKDNQKNIQRSCKCTTFIARRIYVSLSGATGIFFNFKYVIFQNFSTKNIHSTRSIFI